jgi:hypothetical protein
MSCHRRKEGAHHALGVSLAASKGSQGCAALGTGQQENESQGVGVAEEREHDARAWLTYARVSVREDSQDSRRDSTVTPYDTLARRWPAEVTGTGEGMKPSPGRSDPDTPPPLAPPAPLDNAAGGTSASMTKRQGQHERGTNSTSETKARAKYASPRKHAYGFTSACCMHWLPPYEHINLPLQHLPPRPRALQRQM